MSAKHVTEAELRDIIKQEGVVVVDFYAEWCPPCKVMSPIIDSLSEDSDLSSATIVKVDIDKEPNLGSEFKVMSLPTFIILKTDGSGDYTVEEKMIGAQDPLDLKTKIQSYL